MNYKIIFAIAVFICAIISAPVVGNHEIIVQVKDLGHDGNGFEVRGQTAWYNDGSGVAYVAIDKDWVNSPDANVIICHEFGHVNHPDWSEAQCDDFANQQGVGYIEDAYHNGR
jgi:hypothetical protein